MYLPTGETMTVYEAAMKYKSDGTSLVVLAGKEYGMGSSRDCAAKGTFLLGVKAVIAESFERIHRSNLIGMGVLPLQFMPGESRESLGLSGHETFAIELPGDLGPKHELTVKAVTLSPPRRKGSKGDAPQSKSESKSKSETLGDWENEGGNVPDNPSKSNKTFNVIARLDTPIEVDYYNNGGILQTVLRGMVG